MIPYYFPAAVPRNNFLSNSYGSIKQIIKEYFWSANALRTVLMLIRGDAQYVVNEKDNYPYEAIFMMHLISNSQTLFQLMKQSYKLQIIKMYCSL